MRMVECPICGKETLKLWKEQHEFWGKPVYEDMEECINPDCGVKTCEHGNTVSDVN